MKYMALLLTLAASSVNASSPGNCLSVARDYLIAMDQLQPEMLINAKRERFITVCRTDEEFINKALIERIAEGDAVYAIQDDHGADRLAWSSYRM